MRFFAKRRGAESPQLQTSADKKKSLTSYDLTQWLRPLSRFVERRLPRVYTAVRRIVLDLRLLLGGKLFLFAVLDALLVLSAFFDVMAEGGGINLVYVRVVVIPALVIGVPALSSVLALERRAGSLDLALAVPSTVRFFLRRASAVIAVLTAQSVGLLLLAYVERTESLVSAVTTDAIDLIRALAQTGAVLLLLPAVVLFWSVRTRSAGAVMVGSAATLLLLMPWVSRPPIPEPSINRLLGVPVWILSWGLDFSILVAAVLVFGLYARERLRRPERLLT